MLPDAETPNAPLHGGWWYCDHCQTWHMIRILCPPRAPRHLATTVTQPVPANKRLKLEAAYLVPARSSVQILTECPSRRIPVLWPGIPQRRTPAAIPRRPLPGIRSYMTMPTESPVSSTERTNHPRFPTNPKLPLTT